MERGFAAMELTMKLSTALFALFCASSAEAANPSFQQMTNAANLNFFVQSSSIAPSDPTSGYYTVGWWGIDTTNNNVVPWFGFNTNADYSNAFVVAGISNQMASDGTPGPTFDMKGSVIVAGVSNANIGSDFCFLGGGAYNEQDSSFSGSVLVGGLGNFMGGNYGFIGGGYSNSFVAADFAVVTGGYRNTIGRVNNGTYSVIPGGFQNDCEGVNSFVAGTGSTNNFQGCFLWSDSQGDDMTTAQDQFRISAHGGTFVDSGSLYLTNNTAALRPIPVTGFGAFYVSNQSDLYWITKLKTNLIVLGH